MFPRYRIRFGLASEVTEEITSEITSKMTSEIISEIIARPQGKYTYCFLYFYITTTPRGKTHVSPRGKFKA